MEIQDELVLVGRERKPRKQVALRPWMAAAASGVVTLAAYAATLAPSLVEGDQPELMAAVHVLGVPHPTGYPLLVLLGKLLEVVLPVGPAALRLNLVSALFGAAAAGLLAWTAARASGRPLVGLVAGVLVGLGPGLWGQSVAFEVYSLHALLIALVLAAVVRWDQAGRAPRAALWVAAAAGLALTNHRTALAFALPAWLAVAVWSRPRSWKLAAGLLAAIVPNLLYLVLIPLAARQPAANWGEVQVSLTNWFWHVSGLQYKRFIQVTFSPEALLAGGTAHWMTWGPGYTVVTPLLALAGLASLLRRSRPLAMVSLVGGLLTAAWAYSYQVFDAVVYGLPVEMLLAVWAAVGLGAVVSLLRRLPALRSGHAVGIVAGVLAVVVAFNLARTGWHTPRGRRAEARTTVMGKSGPVEQAVPLSPWRLHRGLAMALESLPPDALLVVEGDTQSGGFLYLQAVEGRRRDVTVVPVGLLKSTPYLAGKVDPVVAAAGGQAMADWAAHPGSESSLGEFAQRFVRLLMQEKGGRPLFTVLNPASKPPELAWRDDGLTAEALPAWPSFEAPATESLPPGELLACPEATVDTQAVRRGEIFHLRFRWLLGKQVPGIIPVEAKLIPHEQWVMGNTAGGFSRMFPVAYGRVPLPATPAGRSYVQTEVCMAPPDVPAGTYDLSISSPALPQPLNLPLGLEVK